MVAGYVVILNWGEVLRSVWVCCGNVLVWNEAAVRCGVVLVCVSVFWGNEELWNEVVASCGVELTYI